MDQDEIKNFICEFCGANVSSEKTLKRHQLTAVFCLKKQNKKIPVYVCEWCGDKFKIKSTFMEHKTECIKKDYLRLRDENKKIEEILAEKERELIEKNNEIIDLKNKVNKLRKRTP